MHVPQKERSRRANDAFHRPFRDDRFDSSHRAIIRTGRNPLHQSLRGCQPNRGSARRATRSLARSRRLALEEFTALGTHSVTHVDAPWHYNSHIQGQPAATIDDLPLDWFFADGVVLTLKSKSDAEKITSADLKAQLAEICYVLKPLDIVLVYTGRNQFYSQPDYSARGCAVTTQATHWLYEQGVRVMGIDAWGWDGPLDAQANEALARSNPGVFWAAHQSNLAYSQIERLVNLGALSPFGFKVACFPLKIHRGSAGPARVFAILPD